MKNFFITILVLLSFKLNFYSQEEIFTNFNESLVLTNPAYAGINNNTSFKAIRRNQWVRVPSQFTSNGFSIDSWENFLKMSFALSFQENIEGESILKTTHFKLGWNYRLGDEPGSRYSFVFGLQYSNSSKSIDWEHLTFIGDFDPLLGNINQGLFNFPSLNQIKYNNLSSGILFNYDLSPKQNRISNYELSKLSIGGSINNLIKSEVVFINESINHSEFLGFPRKLSIHGLLEWKNINNQQETTIINHGFFFQKSGFLEILQLNLAEINIYPLKIGFSYRNQLSNINNVNRESVVFTGGYQLIKSNFSFSLLFSRDFTISELGDRGTNEIMLIIENTKGGIISKFHSKSEKNRAKKSIPCNKFNTKSQISTRMGYM
jgi:type IX secretion system PorP/SprF family membrane protein